jgi:hypothetical protein
VRLRDCLIVCLVFLGAGISAETVASGDPSVTKYEIKKFRFGGNRRKGYERLVVEFNRKESGPSKPTLKVVPNTSGKEATLYVDQAVLVGAIPEALINDSYVTKSKYLGPVSINTDGSGSGFSIRAFLKDAVTMEAFLLEHPSRLVLDVIPMNPDVIQPISHAVLPTKNNPSRIVCYPASQQVIATVDFHPKTGEPKTIEMDSAKLDKLEAQLISSTGKKVETAICFPANSQLAPNISYQPKLQEPTTYVQQDPMFVGSKSSFLSQAPPMTAIGGGGTPQGSLLQPQRSLGSVGGLNAGAAPAMPSMPAMPAMGGGAAGAPPSLGPPRAKAQMLNPGSLTPPLK